MIREHLYLIRLEFLSLLLVSALVFSQTSSNDDANARLVVEASRGNAEVVRELLANGADANARSKNGLTALMCSASAGADETVRLLLKAGADPNLVDSRGFSALQLAISLGHAGLVPTLLEAHADVNKVNSAGATALVLAVIIKNVALAKILIGHGANVNPKGVNSGMQPLFLAKTTGQTEMVRVLRSAGAR